MLCNRTRIMRACTVLITCHLPAKFVVCLRLPWQLRACKIPMFSVVVITVSRCSVFQSNNANVYLLALIYNRLKTKKHFDNNSPNFYFKTSLVKNFISTFCTICFKLFFYLSLKFYLTKFHSCIYIFLC